MLYRPRRGHRRTVGYDRVPGFGSSPGHPNKAAAKLDISHPPRPDRILRLEPAERLIHFQRLALARPVRCTQRRLSRAHPFGRGERAGPAGRARLPRHHAFRREPFVLCQARWLRFAPAQLPRLFDGGASARRSSCPRSRSHSTPN